jgi:hypothetical protein
VKGFCNVFIAAALGFALCGPAASAVIYDANDHPNQLGGANFGTNAFADDFVVDGNGKALISDGHFYTLEDATVTTAGAQVHYAFYTDNNGAPGTILQHNQTAYSKTATGNTAFGVYNEFEYSFDLNMPLLVDEGMTYWFTVYITDANGDGLDSVFWEAANATPDTGSLAWRGDSSLQGPWVEQANNYAFYLTGTTSVPAPGPLSLLLLGGTLLALKRKR